MTARAIEAGKWHHVVAIADGKKLREIVVAKGKKSIHGLAPLANGGILISTAGESEVKEFDKDGKLVWHLSKADMLAAGVIKVGYTGGVQRLANGNTAFAMYGGNPAFVEFTPEKKMVWSYHNQKLGNVAGLTLLDQPQPMVK